MKKFHGASLAAVCAMGLAWSLPLPARPSPAKSNAKSTRSPVVVELFTSEGCSDCPPADNLLRGLESEQPIAGAEIIPIEEHVDYWNRQGWIDPFSSVDWTQRQVGYASVFKQKQVYSPEMVVDGRVGFPGGNVQEAEQTIEQAARQPQTSVSLAPGPGKSKHAMHFDVTVGELQGDVAGDEIDVWLAVTEDGLHDSVTAGENKGHVLYHGAVLRSLKKIGEVRRNHGSVSFRGNALVKFNSHWNPRDLRVVAFLQDRKSKRILGAASVPLPD